MNGHTSIMKRFLAFLLVLLMLLSPLGQIAETRAYASDTTTEDQGDTAPKNEDDLTNDDHSDNDNNDNNDNYYYQNGFLHKNVYKI